MQTKKTNKGLILIALIMTAVTVATILAGCFADEKEPEAPNVDYMALHTDGRELKNANDEVVFLKGVNVGGLFIQENWMCPTNMDALERADEVTLRQTLVKRFGYERAETLLKAYRDAWWTESDFDNVKNAGLNLIRLPFGYFDIEDENGDYTRFETLDWFVEECAKREIYLILDLHGAYGSQNAKDHSGDISGAMLFEEEENIQKTAELWGTIAGRYKGNPVIAGFDIINEPEGQEGCTTVKHWNAFNDIYKAIREEDPDRIVIMESVWETKNLPPPIFYKWENVIYSYHNYCWHDYDNAEVQNAFTAGKIKDYNATYDVPLFVGEFTLFSSREAWEYGLREYEANGVNYCVWTYKVYAPNGSTWGLYVGSGDGEVDPVNDSYDEILRKWSSNVTSEDTYKFNDLYKNLFTKEN